MRIFLASAVSNHIRSNPKAAFKGTYRGLSIFETTQSQPVRFADVQPCRVQVFDLLIGEEYCKRLEEAEIGAASGGVAGSIYDLATR